MSILYGLARQRSARRGADGELLMDELESRLRPDGKNALITGASRGIGLAIAQRYREAGASVFVLLHRVARKVRSLDGCEELADAFLPADMSLVGNKSAIWGWGAPQPQPPCSAHRRRSARRAIATVGGALQSSQRSQITMPQHSPASAKLSSRAAAP